MPKVKRSRKPPPDGWELIEPTLDELDQKMREGNSPKTSSPLMPRTPPNMGRALGCPELFWVCLGHRAEGWGVPVVGRSVDQCMQWDW